MAEAKFGAHNTEDLTGLAIATSQLILGTGTKTASATAGAATLNQPSGIITTEALTTAAAGAATYTLTLTNSKVSTTDIVQVTIGFGTNTNGCPTLVSVVPGDGSVVIKVMNTHASAALNGTLKIYFNIVKV